MEAVFDILNALAPIGEAPLDNPDLPPPPPQTHAAQDCIVPGTPYAELLDGIYNKAHTRTVALQHMCEAGYIIYLVNLRCQPFPHASHQPNLYPSFGGK